jgi:hypothetical protein
MQGKAGYSAKMWNQKSGKAQQANFEAGTDFLSKMINRLTNITFPDTGSGIANNGTGTF